MKLFNGVRKLNCAAHAGGIASSRDQSENTRQAGPGIAMFLHNYLRLTSVLFMSNPILILWLASVPGLEAVTRF